jgi:hypothetical protein
MRPTSTRALAHLLLDRSGSMHVMGAFMILVAMGIGAVSVDLIAVQNTSERLQVAAELTCDRIRRADNSLYSTSSDLAAAAQQFLKDQLKTGPLDVETAATVIVTRPEKGGEPIAGSELKVALKGDVDTIMAKYIGMAGSKVDVVRICNPQPIQPETCTDDQKSFLVMTSPAQEQVPMRTLREQSKLSRNAFVMTLTDEANAPILRQTITSDLTIGTSLGGRTLLETDRVHFQPANLDGTIPIFCPGIVSTTTGGGGSTDGGGGGGTGGGGGNGGGTCIASASYQAGSKFDDTQEDSDFDPAATRQWRTSGSVTTEYFYVGRQFYDSGPSNFQMTIPVARHYTANPRHRVMTVRYKTIVGGKQSTHTTSTTIEHIFLSKLKARPDTLRTVLNGKLRLVFVRDPNKALWEAPNGACVETVSPIVLALDGRNTIRTTGISTSHESIRIPERTVRFDLTGSGRSLSTEWIIGDGGQALLVDNRDGRAAQDMNGNRLFGAQGSFENGYEKLRTLDTSGTGVLRGADLDGLTAWIDNGNAVVDAGELVSVHDLGITELGTELVTAKDDRGLELMRSWAVRNGSVIMTEDVWFAVTDREVAEAPAVPDTKRN